jgi:hypothetical protein
MSFPQTLSAGLEKILTSTNDCLRACASGDPEALHRALDEREALIHACQKLAITERDATAEHSICVAIERLNADVEDAAVRLRDALAAQLATVSRTKLAVGDYLSVSQPSRRLDRAF